MAKYNPPEQAKFMQWFDIVCVVAAIFFALWFPLYMGWAGNTKEMKAIENPTWESLNQTPAQAEQWKAVLVANGVKEEEVIQKAHDMIQNKWNYDINWMQLLLLTIALVGYFVFMFKASDREYRDVIDEKFNGK